jgi:hypothetical protein
MNYQVNKLGKDPFTFLNQYPPLRIHPMTKATINISIRRYKPASEQLLLGVLLTERNVVSVMKFESKFNVVPAGNYKIMI